MFCARHGVIRLPQTRGTGSLLRNDKGVMRNSFTRFSVAREGLASGRLAMIH